MDAATRIKLPSKSTTMVKPTFKKVQVVYYLSKNGQLEHPHVVEVTHLLHHQLRLKDVLKRLSVLRGRGMPSLYSWSCKRMYKSGYVWNDLGENDVVCPSEGDEYVLKASQLVQHSPDKHHEVDHPQTPVQKHKQITPRSQHTFNEEEDQEQNSEKKKIITYINTPSRCPKTIPFTTTTTLSSPPSHSTTSGESNSTSKRFEDGDPYNPSPLPLSRNSMLLQLIACGGSIGFKGKNDDNQTAARKSSSSCSSSLHKGVVCKAAAAVAVAAEDDENEICCMSENPRFGNMQSEEREYFSGSIVETMVMDERVQVEPVLNKSSSYKEERISKAAMTEEEEEEEMKREKNRGAGNCIPKRFCLKSI